MKTLQINNEHLSFIGDFHGAWDSVLSKINRYTNTCFIVVGDNAFGFTNILKIQTMIKRMWTAALEKRNNQILFIRGNHDSIEWFSDEYKSHLDTDRFILLQDYTLVQFNKLNILCIGGAVSIDRRFRKDGTSWWIGEELIDPIEPINKPIDILATHTTSRAHVDHLLPKQDWIRRSFQEDKKLKYDCIREDEICDKLLSTYCPPLWVHGHFHVSDTQIIFGYNTQLVSLNCEEFYDYRAKD